MPNPIRSSSYQSDPCMRGLLQTLNHKPYTLKRNREACLHRSSGCNSSIAVLGDDGRALQLSGRVSWFCQSCGCDTGVRILSNNMPSWPLYNYTLLAPIICLYPYGPYTATIPLWLHGDYGLQQGFKQLLFVGCRV